jgi:hypothetical protein
MTVYQSTFVDIQNDVADKAKLLLADDGTNIKAWINAAYADVASATRCFQQTAGAAMTAGVGSYTLDPTILHIELVTVTQTGGDTWFPLKECELDEILNLRALNANATGPSTRYCLVGLNQLEVWPAPTNADTMTFWYSYLPAQLVNDSDVPLLPEPHCSNLLGYGALVQAAEFKRDIMMLGDFQGQYAASMQDFQKYLNRKAGAYPMSFPTWTRLDPWAPHDRSTDVPDWSYR